MDRNQMLAAALGGNFHQPMTGHTPQVQQWLVAQGHAPQSSLQTFGQASTQALGLPPWAIRDQIDARLSQGDPTAARLQGGNPQIRDALLGSMFANFNTPSAQDEGGSNGAGGDGGSSAAFRDELLARVPVLKPDFVDKMLSFRR